MKVFWTFLIGVLIGGAVIVPMEILKIRETLALPRYCDLHCVEVQMAFFKEMHKQYKDPKARADALVKKTLKMLEELPEEGRVMKWPKRMRISQSLDTAANTKIFENHQYGFRFQYPADWSLEGINTIAASFLSPKGDMELNVFSGGRVYAHDITGEDCVGHDSTSKIDVGGTLAQIIKVCGTRHMLTGEQKPGDEDTKYTLVLLRRDGVSYDIEFFVRDRDAHSAGDAIFSDILASYSFVR